MNIIQAKEAALAGKTVICPNGYTHTADSFKEAADCAWGDKVVFGEWSLKQEPVVFETTVLPSGLEGYGILPHSNLSTLAMLVGKKVKVTVEVI